MYCVLNICDHRVFVFAFVRAHKVERVFMCRSKKAPGEAALFGGEAGRLEQPLKRVQAHSGSLVSLLDIQLCSSHRLLISGLMRLSPPMFLLYLSLAISMA